MKRSNVISVVMPVFNVEKQIKSAIDSVLMQSFTNFELIIIDDGSTDNTLSVICEIKDERIILLQNKHDFISSLNLGLSTACGKYIARMDADDMMHVDRLQIQYSILEEEANMVVCATWVMPFGNEISKGQVASSFSGWVLNPLLELLKGNIFFHPTTMIRKSFLDAHRLKYENYQYAEDYKLWTEIAKHGGGFYTESLPLLYYRLSPEQTSSRKREEQQEMAWRIKQEIITELLRRYDANVGVVKQFYKSILGLIDSELLSKQKASDLLYDIIKRAITRNY